MSHKIYAGDQEVTGVYHGADVVTRVYRGKHQIWPAPDVPDAMTPHKFWRLSRLVADAGNYIVFGETYLRQTIGGANEIPIHSKQLNHNEGDSDGPQNTYDGDNSNYSHSEGDGNYNQWISYEYTDPIFPAQIYLSMSTSNISSRCPRRIVLEWSDDGLTGPWTILGVIAFGGGWSNGESRTRPVVISPADPDGHRFWKIGEGVSDGGSGYVVTGDFFLTAGGDNLIPRTHAPGGYGQDEYWALYDGREEIYGHSAPGASGSWEVAFEYHNPVLPDGVSITASSANLPERTLRAGNVYWSDDSITGPWTLAGSFSVGSGWSGGQNKTGVIS